MIEPVVAAAQDLAANDLPASLELARQLCTASKLQQRWAAGERIVVLDTAFGRGLHFLATWELWRASDPGGQLHYLAWLPRPLPTTDLVERSSTALDANLLAGQLRARWPLQVAGFHRLEFDEGAVILTLLVGDAISVLRHLVASVNTVFLESTTASTVQEYWTPPLLSALTRCVVPAATIAGHSPPASLCDALTSHGWVFDASAGATHQHIRCGRFEPPSYRMRRTVAVPPLATARRSSFARPPCCLVGSPAPTFEQQRAIVIGAGLAGTTVAERLAIRAWQVDVIDANHGIAHGASGNPKGILLPRPSVDNASGDRLARACYLYALRRISSLPGVNWSPCGVIQIARNAAHEAQQRSTVNRHSFPAEYIDFLEREAVTSRTGHAVPQGGWWFAGGGWVSPASLSAALLAQGGERIRLHLDTHVAALTHDGSIWSALAENGHVIATASHVVLANAHAASALLPDPLPLTPVRGQISYLPAGTLPPLPHVLCREGYVIAPDAGSACVGASFDDGDTDLSLRVADHAANLQRLDDILPGVGKALNPSALDGRTALRTATVDRLPMAGPIVDTRSAIIDRPRDPTLQRLPRHPGMYALLGLGSRGLLWAPLLAELIASQMHGDPLPLEHELIQAIDPGRFHLRALRKNLADRLLGASPQSVR